MLTNDDIDNLVELVSLRGADTYESYLMEEMGELLQAISKKNRSKPGAYENLQEELTDVMILSTALYHWYNDDDWQDKKMDKMRGFLREARERHS